MICGSAMVFQLGIIFKNMLALLIGGFLFAFLTGIATPLFLPDFVKKFWIALGHYWKKRELPNPPSEIACLASKMGIKKKINFYLKYKSIVGRSEIFRRELSSGIIEHSIK